MGAGGAYGAGGFRDSLRDFQQDWQRAARRAPQRPPVIEGSAVDVSPRSRPAQPYARGARVFHQKFGYGTVVAVDHDKLEVDFEQAGTKKVMDSFVVPADRAG
jgi:DNA helicase-2/ATP-dependent DNA helicase PcrA